jgi:fluoride exporter
VATEIALVAVGGALGSLTRYGISAATARLLGKGFPWGTLLVNVAGCFLMGFVVQFLLGLESRPQLAVQSAGTSFWRYGVAIGFLGGLTTFSAFGADTVREFVAERPGVALANIAANLALSFFALWCGMLIMRAAD